MWLVASILATIFIQAPQGPTTDRPVQLEVAVRTYRADGSAGSYASSTVSATGSGHIWLDGSTCGMGAGTDGPEGAPHGVEVWASSGHIVRHTGDEYLVELDVHHVGGPTGSISAARTLTLHLGQPMILEEIPASTTRCNGRSVRIEAAVVPATERSVASGGVGTGSRATGGGAATAAGSRPTVNTGFGSGNGPRPIAKAEPGSIEQVWTLQALSRATSSSQLVKDVVAERPDMSGVLSPGRTQPVLMHLDPMKASYRAEVWLVYSTDTGTQKMDQRSIHIDDSGGQANFNPAVVPANGEPVHTEVSFGLYPMTTSQGTSMLRVVIARLMRRFGDNAMWPGASDRAIPMPKPGEVISFELPPMSGPELVGNPRFELRIRVTPGG